MMTDPSLDKLVAPLRDENVAGASELGGTAAEILRRAAVRLGAGSVDELRSALAEVCDAVHRAQPLMAPMVTLGARVLEAVEGAHSVDAARHAAARAADAFRERAAAREAAVVEAAAVLLPPEGTVATLSASGTVRRLLESEARPRGIRVVCFESRPLMEGRHLARTLSEAGIEVTYAVDAAVDALLPGCDLVLLGCDAVCDAGIVNKIGSLPLARAAHAARAPVYVLADETKRLPDGFAVQMDDERPGAEVWAEAPAGVRVWNRYFDMVPWALVTGVVGEEGFDPSPECAETPHLGKTRS